jgi:photosystem I P700 chlorophyll a apoprotein A2
MFVNCHAIWDHGQPAVEAFTWRCSGPVNISTSGVYEWWFTIGMRTNQDLYTGSVFLALVSALFLFAGWLHLHKLPTFISWFKDRISFKPPLIWSFFGVSSLAWTGHLFTLIPESRGQRWLG